MYTFEELTIFLKSIYKVNKKKKKGQISSHEFSFHDWLFVMQMDVILVI